ncbi:unnamed protein product, partial [Musa acuminata var. zebrina]
YSGLSSSSSSSSSSSFNPSLIIIAAILAAVCLASATIHLLLRFLSRASSSSPQLIHHNPSTPSTRSSSSDGHRLARVEALPILHFDAVRTSSPPDCAVCLSRFRPGDQLRLLPACRHAFHSPCIDAWLLSPAASCPLCRSPVQLPPPPPPPRPASSGAPSDGHRRGAVPGRRRRAGVVEGVRRPVSFLRLLVLLLAPLLRQVEPASQLGLGKPRRRRHRHVGPTDNTMWQRRK